MSLTYYAVNNLQGPSHPLQVESSSYSLQTFGKDTTLSSKEIKVWLNLKLSCLRFLA